MDKPDHSERRAPPGDNGMGSPRTKSPRLGPQELVSFAFGTVARIWSIADSPLARLRMAMITPAPAADSRGSGSARAFGSD